MPDIYWVLLAVVVILGGYLIMMFNWFVKYSNEIANAWGQIDVQLKRRHDLIPALVAAAKQAMTHEQETLTKVTELRQHALATQGRHSQINAEARLSDELSRLLMVWENYPVLKADQATQRLHEDLVSTENRIAYSRGYYNDLVANYNTRVEQYPSWLVAQACGFDPKALFVVDPNDTGVPEVRFQ